MSSKGVLFLPQHRRAFEIMNDQDVRSLVLAVLRYNEGLEVGELSYGAQIAGIFMFEQVDRFNESYDKRCKSNAEIARRREAQRAGNAVGDDDFDAACADAYAEAYTEAAELMADEPMETPKPKKKTTRRTPKKQDAEDIEVHESTTKEHDSKTNAHEHTTNDNLINPNPNQSPSPNPSQNINPISLSNPNPNLSESVPTDSFETMTENENSLRDRETDGAAHEEEYNCSMMASYDDQKTADGDGLDGYDGLDGLERVKENKNLVQETTAERAKMVQFPFGEYGKGAPVIPDRDEVRAYCQKYAPQVDPDAFYQYYDSREWRIAGLPVVSWQGLIRNWQKNNAERAAAMPQRQTPQREAPKTRESSYDVDQFIEAAMRHSFDELR